MEKLILASASPRRAEILRAVGWPFEAFATHADESLFADETAEAAVERLALKKAEAAAGRYPRDLILGADTAVVVDKAILGKPRDVDDARRMLRMLSGRWHDAVTGVALLPHGEKDRRFVSHETTQVRFGALSDAEIDGYVQSGEPMDKAGAYAAQGRAALFIEEIRGDYWNVVGLPIRLVYKLYRQIRRAPLA
ncbi:MAG: nucleoside triphosphate pyrophosphatase [Acidobacteriota bacterium]|jgi:septum formation protein|nr:nucleoside triphosphate pyrophosphatase [Acidobacteriota bacterium]